MFLRLPDVSRMGITQKLWEFISILRRDPLVTRQDLIDLNLVNSNEQRIDDNGDAIDE